MLEAGIYRDIDPATYYADPCEEPSLSQSICKILLERSAWHAAHEHPRLPPHPQADEDETEKYDKPKAVGTAAHAVMIGRGKTLEILDFNDFKSGDAKKARDAAYRASKAPILEKHYAVAVDVVSSGLLQLRDHEDSDAFKNGSGEVALIWQDDGIWCRALVDWLHDDLRTMDDYKTSAMSMAPHVIGMRAETAGWHVQAAFIERGLDILDPAGAGRRRFRFIGQEQAARPYALTSVHMDEHWLTLGRKKVDAAMSIWRRSMQSGKWPGYGSRPIVPEYPAFREKAWLERELSGEFENDPSLIMAG